MNGEKRKEASARIIDPKVKLKCLLDYVSTYGIAYLSQSCWCIYSSDSHGEICIMRAISCRPSLTRAFLQPFATKTNNALYRPQ